MSYSSRFREYFARDVSQLAAASLSDQVEIEIHVNNQEVNSKEVFVFTKLLGKNAIEDRAAQRPDLIFEMTHLAAEEILSDASSDIGAIGVNIIKLAFSGEPAKKVRIEIKVGFLSLFSRGYFGVLKMGGSALNSYLATRGLGGIAAIKAALKKIK